jgi:hypothetical protein
LSSFQAGGTKLERFLPKNQRTQRKFLNFENWFNGELSKIGLHFSNKVILKTDVNKKCAPELVFFNKKNEKDLDDF